MCADIGRTDEKRRRQLKLFKDWRGYLEVIEITIIKGDRRSAGLRISGFGRENLLMQRDNIEMGFQPLANYSKHGWRAGYAVAQSYIIYPMKCSDQILIAEISAWPRRCVDYST